MLVHNFINHIRFNELVGGFLVLDNNVHQNIFGAEPHTAHFLSPAPPADLAGQSLMTKLFGEGLEHFLSAGGNPAQPQADFNGNRAR
jgi:hypothetical protein